MNDRGWTLENRTSVRFARSTIFDGVPGLRHGFSLRSETSGSPFDLRRAVDEEPQARERCRRLLSAVGLDGQRPALLHQVHGSLCVASDLRTADGRPPRADAVLALEGAGIVPAVRTADCLPLLIVDGLGRWAAAVHAGWRGLAVGVLAGAIAELKSRGVAAASLVAAIGPSIGPCCYEVGAEVLESVAQASRVPVSQVEVDRRRLDLRKAARIQLVALGIDSAAISTAPWCTCCRTDLFYSYRRDGSGTGSHLSCVGWTGSEPSA